MFKLVDPSAAAARSRAAPVTDDYEPGAVEMLEHGV
jgi:hypothetical protein